jgi:hypothetical protein
MRGPAAEALLDVLGQGARADDLPADFQPDLGDDAQDVPYRRAQARLQGGPWPSPNGWHASRLPRWRRRVLPHRHTVVLGLGNPILSVDAVGLRVAASAEHLLQADPMDTMTVVTSTRAGFELIELLTGAEDASIVNCLDLPEPDPASFVGSTCTMSRARCAWLVPTISASPPPSSSRVKRHPRRLCHRITAARARAALGAAPPCLVSVVLVELGFELSVRPTPTGWTLTAGERAGIVKQASEEVTRHSSEASLIAVATPAHYDVGRELSPHRTAAS